MFINSLSKKHRNMIHKKELLDHRLGNLFRPKPLIPSKSFLRFTDNLGDAVSLEYNSGNTTTPQAIFNDGAGGTVNITGNVSVILTSTLGISTTVNYTYDDITVSRIYNIVDIQPPVFVSFTDESNDTVNIEYGDPYTIPNANFNDNEKGSFVVNPSPTTINTSVVVGTEYNIVYMATDNAGLSTTKIKTITIVDSNPPTYTSITYSLPYGSADSKIQFNVSELNTNSYMKIVKNSTTVYYSNPTIYYGNFAYTYTSDDYDTAEYKISFVKPTGAESVITTLNITIEDLIPPTITFSDGWISGDTNITAGDGYTLPTASAYDENDDGLYVVITYDTLYDNSTAGTYTYTYSTIDDADNTKTVSRSYVVVAHAPPTFTYHGYHFPSAKVIGFTLTDISEESYFKLLKNGVQVLYDTELTYSENTVISYTSETYGSAVYTISIVSVATGVESSTQQATIELVDTTPPSGYLFSDAYTLGTGDTIYEIHQGPDTIPTATFSDDSGNAVSVSISYSQEYNKSILGTYLYTWVVTDTSGNENSLTRTFIVEDNIQPIININGTNYNDGSTATIQLIQNGTQPVISVSDNSGESITATASPTLDITTVSTQVITYTASDSSGNTTNVYITYNIVYHGLTGITLSNPTSQNIRIDFTGIGTYNHIHYSVNGGTEVMLASGATYVEFDAGSYGIFNISAKAVDISHNQIGNEVISNITLVEPSGTIETPTITDLSFTVNITSISKDNITVDLLNYAGDSVLVPGNNLGASITTTITHTESSAGTYDYKVRFTDNKSNVKLVDLVGVVLTEPASGGSTITAEANLALRADFEDSSVYINSSISGTMSASYSTNTVGYGDPLNITTVHAIQGVKSGFKETYNKNFVINNFIPGPWTISFWYKYDNATIPTNYYIIMSQSLYYAPNAWSLYIIHSTQKIGIFYVEDDGAVTIVDTTINTTDILQKWTFISLTSDNKIYIKTHDGASSYYETLGYDADASTTGDKIQFGDNTNSYPSLNTYYDDIRVYNNVLNETELDSVFAEIPPPAGA